jgi:4,5-epoxidase
VEWGRELVRVGDDGATLADGEVVRARFIVSCEGAHSVARKSVGIAFEGKTFPHDFIMADVAMETPLTPGEAHSWLHPAGIVNAIGMPGENRWRLFIEAGDAAVEQVTLEAVRDIYRQRSGDGESRLFDPTWLTRFKIHSRMVSRFSAGNVFLAGDAAHLHSPSGGQGITTGMQDAYNLAWKLAQVLRHGAPTTLLDTYDDERRPAARAVLHTTDRNTHLMFPTSRIGKWFRNHVFMPLLNTRAVQRRLVARLSQLDMGYRGSRLSRHLGRRRLRAGDRTPDVRLGDRTLFQLLSRLRWVALFTTDDPLRESLSRLGVETRVVVAEGDFARLYGASSGELFLIRPDGYLGLVCPLERRRVIAEYLASLWPDAGSPAAAKLQPSAA